VGNPLNALYEAVGWVLTRIYDFLSPIFGASSGWTWALSIIILVVLMRLIMVPLFIKQMHTTRAMTSLQPQMAALRKKYKNDKQTLNQETMKLYQEAGVNPLMGCLPVVAQLPLFFSLFSVLRAIAEYTGGTPKYDLPKAMVQSAQNAKILGANIADKVLFTHGQHVPLHAKAVIIVAVLISMATTYLTVRQSMKRGMMPAATPDNPMGQSQKYMAYIMPFFALTGLYWPFGLVLYWVTTNVWTLGQQWLLFKRYPYTPPAAADVATAGAPAPAGARGLVAGSKGSKNSPPPAPKVTTTNRPSTTRASTSKAAAARIAAAKAAKAAPASTEPASSDSVAAETSVSEPSAAAPAKSATTRTKAKPSQNGQTQAANGTSPDQNGANGNGSGLRLPKLGRGRAEPEPQPEPAEVKLVRQQQRKQSRSKRSGKR
jgi:YidC/Oxa1 family membrane protein insertase